MTSSVPRVLMPSIRSRRFAVVSSIVLERQRAGVVDADVDAAERLHRRRRRPARSAPRSGCRRRAPARARRLPPTSAAALLTVPSSLGCGWSVLATIATLAPSRAARSAIARPMPRLAPVMNSVLPLSPAIARAYPVFAAEPDVSQRTKRKGIVTKPHSCSSSEATKAARADKGHEHQQKCQTRARFARRGSRPLRHTRRAPLPARCAPTRSARPAIPVCRKPVPGCRRTASPMGGTG